MPWPIARSMANLMIIPMVTLMATLMGTLMAMLIAMLMATLMAILLASPRAKLWRWKVRLDLDLPFHGFLPCLGQHSRSSHPVKWNLSAPNVAAFW